MFTCQITATFSFAMTANSIFEKATSVAIVALTILVSALAMSPSVADPDLWGHVQFGRDFLSTGILETTTSYSFTAEGYRWINHENLSEILLAWTVENYGPLGLVWGKFLLSLFVIGSVLWFNYRRQVSLIPNCALTILVAWNLGYHWSFRPQLLTFFYFTLMVILLQFAFTGWKDNWHLKWFRPAWLTRNDSNDEIDYSWMHSRLLWLAPILLCLWTNSHGGFAAGVCIYIAYLGCRAIEALTSYWPKGWGLVRRMSLMIVVAILATFVNPYSYRLPMWLFESLGTPRPEILDWSSGQLMSLVGFKFWALVAITIGALVYSRKSLDFTQTVILSLTLWQAFSHFRHVPFFAILAGFWVGPHLQSAFVRLTQGASEATQDVSSKGKLAIATVMVALVALIGWRLSDRLDQLKVDKQVFPVDAFQYIHDNKLGGRLVVTYDWAQYSIAAMCVEENLQPGQPVSRVAFDGRFRTCYPQPIVDMHFDLLFGDQMDRSRSDESGQINPTRVLEYGTPDLVLIKRQGELSESVLTSQTENWALLFQDGMAQLWGRRAKYDNPQSPDFVPESNRIIGTELPRGYVDWPALPKKSVATSIPHQVVRLSQ